MYISKGDATVIGACCIYGLGYFLPWLDVETGKYTGVYNGFDFGPFFGWGPLMIVLALLIICVLRVAGVDSIRRIRFLPVALGLVPILFAVASYYFLLSDINRFMNNDTFLDYSNPVVASRQIGIAVVLIASAVMFVGALLVLAQRDPDRLVAPETAMV
jgi:hypothetical protein